MSVDPLSKQLESEIWIKIGIKQKSNHQKCGQKNLGIRTYLDNSISFNSLEFLVIPPNVDSLVCWIRISERELEELHFTQRTV